MKLKIIKLISTKILNPPERRSSRDRQHPKFIYLALFVLLWLFQFTTALYAQQGLTLRQAWKITRQNNYTLQQQEKMISSITEEVAIQRTGYLPTLSTGASYNYVSELARLDLPITMPGLNIPTSKAGVKNQYDLTLMVMQPIFLGFRTRNLVKSAAQQLTAQSQQKIVIQNQLLLQVGQLYYNVQLNLLQQDVFQESIKRAENQLERLRNLFLAKQVTAFDTLEVANRKLQLSNHLLKFRDLNNILISQLSHILNQKNLPKIERMKTESVTLALKSLAEYQSQAVFQRPELQQVFAFQQAQSFRIKARRSAYYPQVNSSFSYHYGRPGVNFFKDEWLHYYTLGVNLQWNLWNWKKDQRKVQQAKLELEKLSLQHKQVIEDIHYQVKQAYKYLQITHQQIQLQQKLMAQEKERYRITEEKYQQGLATALDISTAEHALTQAQLEQQKNYITYLQYRLQLDFATGTIGR